MLARMAAGMAVALKSNSAPSVTGSANLEEQAMQQITIF